VPVVIDPPSPVRSAGTNVGPAADTVTDSAEDADLTMPREAGNVVTQAITMLPATFGIDHRVGPAGCRTGP
jgi:hypothetical protein